MDNEKDFLTNENSGYSRQEQTEFWKKKWLKERRLSIVLGLVLTPVIVYLVYRRGLVELSPAGWVIVLLLFYVIDLLYYFRKRNEYVMAHLANKTDSDHDPDDDRFYKGNERI